MALEWKLSRDEAEYLVDILDKLTDLYHKDESEHWRAEYLADELRTLFDMGDRYENHKSYLNNPNLNSSLTIE